MVAERIAAADAPTTQWRRGAIAGWVLRNRLPLAYAAVLVLIGSLAALYIYSGCCIVFREPIRSDGFGYYAYLPAFFIDHNLTMKTALAYRWTVVTVPLGYIWYGIAVYPPTGNLLDKYTLGTALLQSPAFLLAHTVARAWGMSPYSAPYQSASAISALLFFGAGEFLLFRSLLRRHSPATALLAACAVTFATNLFHVAAYSGSFSHVYSFFLFALLLTIADSYRMRGAVSAEPLVGHAIGFGVVLGLIALTRVPNVIGGIIPLMLMGERLYRTRNAKSCLLESTALVAALLLLFAPQAAYWHAVTGHYFVNSYQDESFNWFHPQLTGFLFSVRKGLFFWAPILFVAMIGLPRFARTEKTLGLAICAVLALEIYICSSWWSWWYGASFGSRPVTDMMPLIVLPLACGLEWMQARGGRIITIPIVAALVVLNLFLMVSYWRELMPWDRATLADFAQLPAKWESIPFLKPAAQRAFALATLGTYKPGTRFLADTDPPRGMWVEGFDKPAWAIWTIGPIATIYVRPELPPKGDLRLNLMLVGNGALMSSRHPSQRAIIKVNGATVGTLTAAYPHPKMQWTFILPRRLFRSEEIARIDFELPDAAAPVRLGIGPDTRLLGLYIRQIDILPAGML